MGKRKEWPKDGLWSHRSKTQRVELLELLGPGAFFPCDHPWIAEGVTVPGRRGGRVEGCATPTAKAPNAPHVWLGPLGTGAPMKVATARDRLRQKRDPKRRAIAAFDADALALAVSLAVDEFRLFGVPAPVGRLHRGRVGSSKCDREHPLWSDYDDALADADAEASLRFDDPSEVPEREYREALRSELKRADPARFDAWLEATRGCVESYEMHKPRARGYESPQAAVARRRRDFLQVGGDVGHGDYTDQLADSTKRAKERKRSSSSRSSTKKKRTKGARA